MTPLALLLLFFLGGCGIIHIEVRDRTPQKTVSERTDDKRSATQTRAETPPQREEPPKPPEVLRVQSPVKGRAIRTQRGYFIATSCGEFFRSVSDGRVLYAGDDIRGMGWVVMVDAQDGYIYVYAKAESLLVKRGEQVRKGQPLGKAGRAEGGCGLVFEVRDREGRPVSFELVL